MPEASYQHSAVILEFKPRRRKGDAAKREPAVVTVSDAGGWYHAAAICESNPKEPR
jgi:hypothetical protein